MERGEKSLVVTICYTILFLALSKIRRNEHHTIKTNLPYKKQTEKSPKNKKFHINKTQNETTSCRCIN